MTYDVIVAGAGPAGASAAYWLGEAGYETVVLEKEKLPRYKPCGGGVPQPVFDRFPFDFASVVERWVRHVRFRFKDGREVVADLPNRSVAMVMRDRFDLHILKHACADVREEDALTALEQDASGVTVTTASGKTLRARYLIGADGANSRVSRLVGLRPSGEVGVAVETEITVSDQVLEKYADTALFIFGTPDKGYLWIFPKAGHLSIGIGAFRPRAAQIVSILRKQIAGLGIEIDGARLHGHPLPIHLRREPLRRGRVLLVGDAAGLMDPLLGEGIRHAVDSARLAAECLLDGRPDAYSRSIQREIGGDLLWGRRWAQLFYGHPWGSFELAVRNPLFVRDFLRLFAGELSYRRMAARAIPNVLLGLHNRLPIRHQ